MLGPRRNGTSPEYGTWIRFRAVVVFGVLTAMCLALSLLAFVSPWSLLALVPAAAFGWIFLVIAMARYRFSDAGGEYQARVHRLIQERVRGEAVLDIGCGNGHLAIAVAKDEPARLVTGLDYWGAAWGYSKGVCERNAELEGVSERVSFVQGSAASLPFEDAQFDCVVSCLTFHEVRELTDKTLALSEAMRVLRPGGTFVLLDPFSDAKVYPDQELIAQRIVESGGVVRSDELVSEGLDLPFPLAGKRLLKFARVVTGMKG